MTKYFGRKRTEENILTRKDGSKVLARKGYNIVSGSDLRELINKTARGKFGLKD